MTTRDTGQSQPLDESAAPDDALTGLILRHLDGVTSREESAGLLAELTSNPSSRDLYVSLATQQGQLTEMIAPQFHAATIEQRLRRKPLEFRTERKSRARWALPLAAAALLLLSLGVFIFRPGAAVDSLASMQSVSGSVSILRNGSAIPARAGDPVFEHDVILAPADSTTSLQYRDETTTLTIARNARLQLQTTPDGKRLILDSGRLEASVAHQPANAPLTVLTPAGHIRVLGTHFIAIASPETTRARVMEGRIRMTRTGDGRSIEVPAGSYAVANASRAAFPLAPFKSNECVEGRVVFQDDFENGLSKWTPGVTSFPNEGYDRSFVRGISTNFIRSVTITRDGQKTRCAELLRTKDGKESTLFAVTVNVPRNFRLEFDMLNVAPSIYRFFEYTNKKNIRVIYTNPKGSDLQIQYMKQKQWFRARIDWLNPPPNRPKTVSQLRYHMGDTLMHMEEITDSTPYPPQIGCQSGQIRVDNVILTELVPFE